MTEDKCPHGREGSLEAGLRRPGLHHSPLLYSKDWTAGGSTVQSPHFINGGGGSEGYGEKCCLARPIPLPCRAMSFPEKPAGREGGARTLKAGEETAVVLRNPGRGSALKRRTAHSPHGGEAAPQLQKNAFTLEDPLLFIEGARTASHLLKTEFRMAIRFKKNPSKAGLAPGFWMW
ncbi:hypothetical protein NDU88_008941 [Pleurodeles waltl]|uniref:Uncharacterized protein n=1 Tax=Pleurodeles waltl TaxID=8319 RepID=A0AAV7RWY8_PLEWA|nr:hypothetical protein NDU88_008941 [Pleurodeles waltl]